MKTKAHFKGHPLHPILVAFPIAFLTGALFADVVGWGMGSSAWFTTARHLNIAGVVTALIAAVPGFIDYLFSVPPRSSAKKRATYHLAVNLSAVGLFLVAWLLRTESGEARRSIVIIALELAGVGLITVGGWLGGTLVYRNFIGPEHRYANKGKWKEESFDAGSGDTITVARVEDLQDDQMKLLKINGQRIVLARTGGRYCAFADRCTHRGASLADGVLICGKVQCLWHGSRFEVSTGQVDSGPAESPIAVFLVEQAGEDVRLRVP